MLDRGPRPWVDDPGVIGIKGIGHYWGERHHIAELPQLAADPKRLAAFEARGFKHFTRSPVDEAEMALRACRETLHRTALSAGDIDAVVIGWTDHRWFKDMQERLANRVVCGLGFHNIHVIGLTFVGCTCYAALLRMARNLIVAEGYRNVLVVETNRCNPDDSDRLVLPDWSVYGDGAASCVVTRDAPEFALRSVVQIAGANPNCSVVGSAAAVAHRIVSSTSVFNRALRHAGVKREQIKQYFAPNHAPHMIRQYARRFGIDPARVFTSNIHWIGHPWSADTVINLRHHCQHDAPAPGDLYAAFAWAEGSFSTLVLERTTHPMTTEAAEFPHVAIKL